MNPRLVLTSISNFGQNGPYRDWQGTDLTLYAWAARCRVATASREPVKTAGRRPRSTPATSPPSRRRSGCTPPSCAAAANTSTSASSRRSRTPSICDSDACWGISTPAASPAGRRSARLSAAATSPASTATSRHRRPRVHASQHPHDRPPGPPRSAGVADPRGCRSRSGSRSSPSSCCRGRSSAQAGDPRGVPAVRRPGRPVQHDRRPAQRPELLARGFFQAIDHPRPARSVPRLPVPPASGRRADATSAARPCWASTPTRCSASLARARAREALRLQRVI